MFENNVDVDFGEEFTLDLSKTNKSANKKRPSESPQKETPKKPKFSPILINPVKRKFPGPAGILPDRQNSNSLLECAGLKGHEEIPCSPMTFSAFHDSPWVSMSRKYDNLIDLYNIKWIKTNARLNKLQNNKAPFLAAIIKNIEHYETNKSRIVKVVLKDASGEIQGTILNSLYEEYSKNLVAGSVIVLRQCGVTNCTNNQYLSIIPSNLVTVYWKNGDEVVMITVQEVSCDNLIGQRNCEKRQEKESEGPSQVDVTNDDGDVWKDALEGVDFDSFFGDF